MKRYLAVACLWPALLTAQEPSQSGAAALQKWHEVQVAIGNANMATRANRAEQIELALLELERREKLVFSAYADVGRRKRVDMEQRSLAHLDSVRRSAEPIGVLTMLELRHDCVERFANEARTVEHHWKGLLKGWQRKLDRAKGDDVERFERLVSLARAVIEFEGKRAAELKAESEALLRQIEAAKP